MGNSKLEAEFRGELQTEVRLIPWGIMCERISKRIIIKSIISNTNPVFCASICASICVCASNCESRSRERLFRKELVAANKFRGEMTDSVGNRVILW